MSVNSDPTLNEQDQEKARTYLGMIAAGDLSLSNRNLDLVIEYLNQEDSRIPSEEQVARFDELDAQNFCDLLDLETKHVSRIAMEHKPIIFNPPNNRTITPDNYEALQKLSNMLETIIEKRLSVRTGIFNSYLKNKIRYDNSKAHSFNRNAQLLLEIRDKIVKHLAEYEAKGITEQEMDSTLSQELSSSEQKKAMMILGMIIAGDRNLPKDALNLALRYLQYKDSQMPGQEEVAKFNEFDAQRFCDLLDFETYFLTKIANLRKGRTSNFPIDPTITPDNYEAFQKLSNMLETITERRLSVRTGIFNSHSKNKIRYDNSKAHSFNRNAALLRKIKEDIDRDLDAYKENSQKGSKFGQFLKNAAARLAKQGNTIITRAHKGRSLGA